MNLKYLKYMVLAGVLIITSCSDDYLETIPTSSTSEKTVFESTENAKMAINGLAKLMTKQQSYYGQGFNGEGTIKMYNGNYPGNHFVVGLPGWASVINSEYHNSRDSKYSHYPWYYYYRIIANANQIIVSIDEAEGSDNEKEYIKAQALTYRAYSYTMLAQIYGNRWSDSNNGATDAVVLRVEPDTEDVPVSSLGATYDLIYSDLDTALGLFESSGYKRSDFFEVDASVAQATYARAALAKQDYPTAAKYAELAKADYPLMNNSEYKSGFKDPNQEWIWGSYDSTDETLYFWSFQAYIAYNSTATNVRIYPKMISKELYDQIPDSDVRKDLFLDPTGYDIVTDTGEAKDDLDAHARELFPDLQSNSTIYAYMQFKFSANDMPGVGNLNHFRSSEMYLIEAEAKYFMGGKEDEVRNLLKKLTVDTGRDPNYSVSASGADLLKEIKKYRAIELWGEGFDWFDMKRWGDPIDRKSFNQGGNYLSPLAKRIEPEANNKWTWQIPNREADFNKEVD